MDILTAGTHRRFGTIFIKHSLFHQGKLGTDVEMQNTHFALFKSPRDDVHHVAILGVQLGLASTLVDWHWDASSILFDHFMIDLSPRTDDRLRCCTSSGNFSSRFYLPDNSKYLKYLDDEHAKSLYSPSISALFPRMQNSFSKNLSKRIYPITQREHRQPAARKLVRSKKSRP